MLKHLNNSLTGGSFVPYDKKPGNVSTNIATVQRSSVLKVLPLTNTKLHIFVRIAYQWILFPMSHWLAQLDIRGGWPGAAFLGSPA